MAIDRFWSDVDWVLFKHQFSKTMANSIVIKHLIYGCMFFSSTIHIEIDTHTHIFLVINYYYQFIEWWKRFCVFCLVGVETLLKFNSIVVEEPSVSLIFVTYICGLFTGGACSNFEVSLVCTINIGKIERINTFSLSTIHLPVIRIISQ